MPNIRRSMYHVWSILPKFLAPATAGQLIVGQGANANPAWVTISGDATLAADGTLTIQSGTVQPGDLGTIGKANTNIAQDDAVYISSVTAAGVPVFSIADADVAQGQAVYIATAALTSGSTSTTPIFRKSALSAATLNTNAGNVGDKVYLTTTGTTGNTWSLSAPSAANSIVQVLGRITVKSATVGQIAWDLTGQPQEIIGSNELQALSVGTAALAAGGVTEAKIAANSLTGLVVGNIATSAPGAIASANVGQQIVMQFAIPDGASGNVDFTGVPYKFRVTDVTYVKTAGAGNAGNSIAMHNGTTGNAITNGMNNATDTGTAYAGSLDDAFWDVAAGATIRFVTVRAGGNNAAIITVYGIRLA